MTTANDTVRRVVRTALFSGAFALVISPFASSALANADYKESDFASCLERNMPTDYCCEHAGGVMRNGACINPDDLRVPSSGVFQQADPTTPPKRPPVYTVPSGVFEQSVTATQQPPSANVPITRSAVG